MASGWAGILTPIEERNSIVCEIASINRISYDGAVNANS